MWLFHLHSTVKVSPFLQFSHWRNLQLRHLAGYSFGTLKKGSVMVCGCFISTARWKYGFFIRFSHWRNPQPKHFVGYPFGTSKKASTIFYDTASFQCVGCKHIIPKYLQKLSSIASSYWDVMYWLCPKNGWCFFPWSFKGITRKMP